ncbi:MAG: PLP-dependent transferase [Chthonomonas sp.]|nr:PLP-dependent transferase [Chthonomonas sp.]
MRFATKAIRIGQNPESEHRSVTYPLYQTSTFAWDQIDEEPKVAYSRVNNPNRLVLEEVLASMENGTHCTCFSSGMAAVVAALSLLEAGDHVLVASDIYGGTHRYIADILPRQGISYAVFDACSPESIGATVTPKTKMVVFESPTNPLLRVCDIRAVVAEAQKHGLITVFDNTFASPALQRPLDLGCDIVIHSTTKYITGHSDVIGGALITANPAYGEAAAEWVKNTGASPSPFDAWLCLRGLKTLALRMERHSQNAMRIAEWLTQQEDVKAVYYPGLADNPFHQVAKSQMDGFSGMLSFEFGTVEMAKTAAMNTKIFLLAESLGGVESLIGYPTLMSHGCMTEEERVERGVHPNLLRLSVGIEDADDLIEDLGNAFAVARQSARVAAVKV